MGSFSVNSRVKDGGAAEGGWALWAPTHFAKGAKWMGH
jgi:hypothetical protein